MSAKYRPENSRSISQAYIAKHRSWQAVAKRRWRHASWIRGDGRFATVADCRRDPYQVLTVMLHETREEAERALQRIDSTGCGGGCCGNHALVDLDSTRKSGPGAA